MADPVPSAAELAALLADVVSGVEGGTKEHWAAIIGPIYNLPLATNVNSNWAVIAGGTRRERKVIGKAS